MPDLVSSIRERYLQTLEAVEAAARRAGRRPESARVVVVTKSQPLEVLRAAIQAGAKMLGENYAEEAVQKIMELKSQTAAGTPHFAVEWHMIGHVQSRKAQLVAEHFALFHSLDSLKLAGRMDRLAAGMGRILPVLLEFNVADEPGKYGWAAADETRWPDLLRDAGAIAALPNLKVRGLMTMPPLSAAPEAARPYFQRLRRLRDFLAERAPQAEWTELSMGTSSDYAVAVEEGATLVRVGQAILGPRPGYGG
jgi:pyridoxal phosphate enzyme (YggS family)